MPSSRSVRKTRTAISPRFATRTFVKTAIRPFSLRMTLAGRLTLARAAGPPLSWRSSLGFRGTRLVGDERLHRCHDRGLVRRPGRRWRTCLLARLAPRPVADKLLVLTVLIVLVGRDIFPGWMVAAIVARELLVSKTSPGGARARRGDAGARPRQARDLVAGHRRSDRRLRGRRGMGRPRGVVGASGRPRVEPGSRASTTPPSRRGCR